MFDPFEDDWGDEELPPIREEISPEFTPKLICNLDRYMKAEESDIIRRCDLSELQKLLLCFERHKDELKDRFPYIYYALLGVKDQYKMGYRLRKD